MKNFFANYLIIPKYGTVREKVFMTRIALGLTAIIFCMAAVTYSAYAFFSHGVSSQKNTLVAANYSLEYTVMVGDHRPQDGVAALEDIETVSPSDYDETYKLEPGTYTIVMSKPTSAMASTGFCKIEICDSSGNSSFHYTEQIGKVSPDETVEPVTTRYILITVEGGTAFVKLTASWGTCARTDMILTNGELKFTATDESTSGTDTSDSNSGDGVSENVSTNESTDENTEQTESIETSSTEEEIQEQVTETVSDASATAEVQSVQ